jgi:hypothetical protein
MTSLKWCRIIPEQVVRLHLLSGYCGFMSCLTRVRDCFGSCALTSYCQGGLRLPGSRGFSTTGHKVQQPRRGTDAYCGTAVATKQHRSILNAY